jgi:hypothetical protein
MQGAVDVAITAKAAVMASGSTTSSSAFRTSSNEHHCARAKVSSDREPVPLIEGPELVRYNAAKKALTAAHRWTK